MISLVRKTGSKSLAGTVICGRSPSSVEVENRWVMGSIGQRTGQRTTRKLRTPLPRKIGASRASPAPSATQTKTKTKTITSAAAHSNKGPMPTLEVDRLVLRITSNNDSTITRVATSPQISQHTRRPSRDSTLSSRCTSSTRTKSATRT
jgi:hypothetical protein